jgi:choline dehydrogenase
VHISRQRSPRRSTASRIEAVRQCGYSIDWPNKPEPRGFSETVVTQRRGARWSMADAYLRPALRRKNLKLITEATATRVVFDGPRAVEVEFEKDGERRVVRARREVVLSAGAVNSPQLLMLSGIGDKQPVQRHGIELVHHSPEVGENPRDHFVAYLGFGVEGDTLFEAQKPLDPASVVIAAHPACTHRVIDALRTNPYASPAGEVSLPRRHTRAAATTTHVFPTRRCDAIRRTRISSQITRFVIDMGTLAAVGKLCAG